jgi:hypothetical protein
MRSRFASLAVTLALACTAVHAQDASRALSVACPKAAETTHRDLFGAWTAQFEGTDTPAVAVTLVQHPELAESVRGTLMRGNQRVEVAGDVDEGEFTLEESVNGINISATWLGDVVEGSCGREIRGTWQAEGSRRVINFVMKKR